MDYDVPGRSSVDSPGEVRWGMAPALRAFAAAGLAVVLVIGGLLAFGGARPSDRIGGALFLTLAPLATWLFYWRPYVELSRGFLYIRNPVRSHLIPLGTIRDAVTLNTGLGLELTNGDRVVAWALQQGVLMSLLSRETRATMAMRAITEAAEAVRQGREPELRSPRGYVAPLLSREQMASPLSLRRRALTRQMWWAGGTLTGGVAFVLLATFVLDGMANRYDSNAWGLVSTVVGFSGALATLVGLVWLPLTYSGRRALDRELRVR